MLRNYIISAIRYLLRNRVQSLIEMISLLIGITVVLLVGTYVIHELSYDNFNENKDRIFRLDYGEKAGNKTAVGHLIKENFEELDNVMRISIHRNTYSRFTLNKGTAQEKRVEYRLRTHYCDSTVFDIFSYRLIQGDPVTALRDPYSIVLTESGSRMLFGDEDPVGELLEIEGREPLPFTVTGIVKDPENSHLEFDALLSFSTMADRDRTEPPQNGDSYLNSFSYGPKNWVYLLLENPADKTRIEALINDFFNESFKDDFWWYRSEGEEARYSLLPLNDIYFSNPLRGENGYCLHGNLRLLFTLISIALLMLILACINYINLTTARGSLRAREVALRRISGSSTTAVAKLFLAESVLLTVLAFSIALTILQFLLPAFSRMTGTELELMAMVNWKYIPGLAAGVLAIGIVAGAFPAISFSRLQPLHAFSGRQNGTSGSILLRRILLTFQFTASLIMIVGVLTILKQLSFMKKADLGYNAELVLDCGGARVRDPNKRKVLKEILLTYPGISGVSYGYLPGRESNLRNSESFNFNYNGRSVSPSWMPSSPDYFNLLEVNIIQGRNFDPRQLMDYTAEAGYAKSILVNESFSRELGLGPSFPVWVTLNDSFPAKVIGVVEDFHFLSLHHKIEPCIFGWWNEYEGWPRLIIRISPRDIQRTLEFIRKEFEKMYPGKTFNYTFLDETIQRQYEKDELLGRATGSLSILAMLIGILGLFGLSFFMAERRTKEIGIRKSQGASHLSIFLLLSTEFIKWVTLSLVFALPLGWIIMNRWLQSYAYRTGISWWIFALVIVFGYGISFVTVAWHAWKTARTNPVEALRYE